MITPLLELEATVEEIQKRLCDFAGQRLHVIVLPAETPEELKVQVQRKLSLTDRILARAQKIPPEERDQFPHDLADQHDHYIYGRPKK